MTDRELIEAIAPNIVRLRQHEISAMFEAFEYHSPTGLPEFIKPIPGDVRGRLVEIIQRFETERTCHAE